MTQVEMMQTIVDCHNRLLDISVKGESVLVLSSVVQRMRQLITNMQQPELTVTEDNHDRGED